MPSSKLVVVGRSPARASPRPNPSLNADVPRAGAAPAAAGRRLAPIR